jgi:hypothetical protein
MTHLDPDVLALIALSEFDLTASERNHLATCPDCSRELAGLRRTVNVARSAQAVELLEPADEVWSRIHTDLGLSDAVASPPRAEDFSSAASAASPADPADPADPAGPEDSGDQDDTDDPAGRASVGRPGASGASLSPRARRRQAWLPFAAVASLVCLVGGVALGIRRQSRSRASASVTAEARPGW